MTAAVAAERSVVVDTTASPNARLRPVAVSAIDLTDTFWQPRRDLNRTVTLPRQLALCEETGRLDNFRRVADGRDTPFQGRFFNDSDLYKWLEAAAWTLASADDAALAARVDVVIAVVAAAQDRTGYLNTYFSRGRSGERWSDLGVMHELYCAGHFFQAAVAHHRATGKTTLLTVAERFAEHIDTVFGPGKGEGTCGHPEIEMGLIELARETDNARWLRLARFFLDQRGATPSTIRGGPGPGRDATYYQDHLPLTEQRQVAGHAVRALYLYAGATDAYLETGDAQIWTALVALWRNLQERKVYVTGGVGARHENESFGDDYELPNGRAYAETCAAIAHVMWAWRLLLTTGEARYADAMERALYNGVLAGLSLDGEEYFYVNPLADGGSHRRQPWFGTACCPPNIARLLASLPGYLSSVAGDAIWLHLYVGSNALITLADGRAVRLRQETTYPWHGEIAIAVDGSGEFALHLRIPGWCGNGATIEVNGSPVSVPTIPGTYAAVRRSWQPGDLVRLVLPMPVQMLSSHPAIQENRGRVALTRGPLIYCLEGVDHPNHDLRQIVLTSDAPEFQIEHRPDLLTGVVQITFAATFAPPDATWDDRLYRSGASPARTTANTSITATAIPYYAWANRAPGPMVVWLPIGTVRS